MNCKGQVLQSQHSQLTQHDKDPVHFVNQLNSLIQLHLFVLPMNQSNYILRGNQLPKVTLITIHMDTRVVDSRHESIEGHNQVPFPHHKIQRRPL